MSDAVCEIGGVDDGTLRVCCSTHQKVLCAHHYAVTHFVETMPEHAGPACTDKTYDVIDVIDVIETGTTLRKPGRLDVLPGSPHDVRDERNEQ